MDTISDSLNMAPMPTVIPSQVVTLHGESNKTEMDFEYARGNMIAAIEKGQQALTDVVDVASRTQSPKTFEAVAQILNAVTSANKELLDLSKKRRDIEKLEGSVNPTTVNNNLFVGSTAEVLRMLKSGNEQE